MLKTDSLGNEWNNRKRQKHRRENLCIVQKLWRSVHDLIEAVGEVVTKALIHKLRKILTMKTKRRKLQKRHNKQ